MPHRITVDYNQVLKLTTNFEELSLLGFYIKLTTEQLPTF